MVVGFFFFHGSVLLSTAEKALYKFDITFTLHEIFTGYLRSDLRGAAILCGQDDNVLIVSLPLPLFSNIKKHLSLNHNVK